MNDVAQVALEDPQSLFLGVPALASLAEDGLSSRLATELGHRHPMQDRIDPPVATSVEAMADGLVIGFGRGGRQRRAAVETGEPSLRKSAWITDLDQQLGRRSGRDATNLIERGAALPAGGSFVASTWPGATGQATPPCGPARR